jgi:hypothetical protein
MSHGHGSAEVEEISMFSPDGRSHRAKPIDFDEKLGLVWLEPGQVLEGAWDWGSPSHARSGGARASAPPGPPPRGA